MDDFIPERVTFSAVDDGPGSKIEMPTSELSNRESNGTTLGVLRQTDCFLQPS